MFLPSTKLQYMEPMWFVVDLNYDLKLEHIDIPVVAESLLITFIIIGLLFAYTMVYEHDYIAHYSNIPFFVMISLVFGLVQLVIVIRSTNFIFNTVLLIVACAMIVIEFDVVMYRLLPDDYGFTAVVTLMHAANIFLRVLLIVVDAHRVLI